MTASRERRHRRSVIARRPGPRPVAATPRPAGRPGTVLVAVPARDEADHIVACLRSVDAAAAACGARVHVVVAADRCRDATAELAASFDAANCAVSVVEGRWCSVGAARAAAVAAGRVHIGGDGAWIANTDADCRVPADWLDLQLDLAAQGLAAVAGTVRLADDAPVHLATAFRRMYVARAGRGHVHAANLGVDAAAYDRVGGWSPSSALGEEHNLWRRLRRRGLPVAHHPSLWVATSHRTRGRAIGGFASTLRRLAESA